MTGTLFLVPTPIGNLSDITQRGIDVLQNADIIACEDTRMTQKLMGLLGIKTSAQFVSYHEYNADKMRPILLEKLNEGSGIALVSDAGTPLISDPGYRLVKDVLNANLTVVPLPGANAVLPALQLSGLASDRFLFNGFLSTKKSARRTELDSLKDVPATLIFYESPHRVIDTLSDMLDVYGNRQAAVVRELTKKFEESRRGTIQELLDYYQANGEPKGEVVLLVARADDAQKAQQYDIHALLKNAFLKYDTLRDAVDAVTAQTGLDRRKIYKQAIEIKNG
ncbi:MAG: 16S rRNA (cytidine(1402)-2'-O)-methyltransferase [Alphaproteobacteria bacterium]|nr:16S rRNA (cytidine(1402)-2'-O)-methyltransferase [Alphaproteobacteria bacterium]